MIENDKLQQKMFEQMIHDLIEGMASAAISHLEAIHSYQHWGTGEDKLREANKYRARYELVYRYLNYFYGFLDAEQRYRLDVVLYNVSQYYHAFASNVDWMDWPEEKRSVVQHSLITLQHGYGEFGSQEVSHYILNGEPSESYMGYCPRCAGTAQYKMVPEKARIYTLGHSAIWCDHCRKVSTMTEYAAMDVYMLNVGLQQQDWELMDDEQLKTEAVELNAEMGMNKHFNRINTAVFESLNKSEKIKKLMELKYPELFGRSDRNNVYFDSPVITKESV